MKINIPNDKQGSGFVQIPSSNQTTKHLFNPNEDSQTIRNRRAISTEKNMVTGIRENTSNDRSY